jgi:hypothetical protein
MDLIIVIDSVCPLGIYVLKLWYQCDILWWGRHKSEALVNYITDFERPEKYLSLLYHTGVQQEVNLQENSHQNLTMLTS